LAGTGASHDFDDAGPNSDGFAEAIKEGASRFNTGF
jgi:hypothetical protein